MVRILLENGADPCLADKGGLLPLHRLACSGNKEIADLRLPKGICGNCPDSGHGRGSGIRAGGLCAVRQAAGRRRGYS